MRSLLHCMYKNCIGEVTVPGLVKQPCAFETESTQKVNTNIGHHIGIPVVYPPHHTPTNHILHNSLISVHMSVIS